ncbi:hypothetical protein B0H12DRAFT_1074856 [Mycena haematopus]|nr:hypothetical protein B0H12DRAFT_1074856 [Mycena haematopus]
MSTKHSTADLAFIKRQPSGVIMEFRSSIYQPAYIAANAHLFIDHEWIDVDALRRFVTPDSDNRVNSSPPSSDTPPPRVKVEDDASKSCLSTVAAPLIVKTRTVEENGHQIYEILSDSEPEPDPAEPRLLAPTTIDTRSSSPLPPSDPPSDTSDIVPGTQESDGYSSFEEEDTIVFEKSDTRWLDDDFGIPPLPWTPNDVEPGLGFDFSFLEEYFQAPDKATPASSLPAPAYFDFDFLNNFSDPQPTPPSESYQVNSLPPLPPIPISPPPMSPIDTQLPQTAVTTSKKRKARDEVDQANIIHCTRRRKAPKRADEV